MNFITCWFCFSVLCQIRPNSLNLRILLNQPDEKLNHRNLIPRVSLCFSTAVPSVLVGTLWHFLSGLLDGEITMRLALQPRSKCAFWAGHVVDISDYHNRFSGKKEGREREPQIIFTLKRNWLNRAVFNWATKCQVGVITMANMNKNSNNL